MNASERLPLLLREMRQAAGEARQMLGDRSFEEFERDLVLQRAIGMTLLIVAEAASQVTAKAPEFVAEHPDIPWTAMRGMRNRMAHGYLSVNLRVVYEAALVEAPALAATLDGILNRYAQGE
ncbi:uncharacterized protein with HEPN domain [Ciceribacter lividus]|uniref:Uncharacterized protein with HEPN domain n=1 Tax=Ciceribacter lividus TaxID=1197950 RepID=A0A6I7HTI2_9HYPH|nr:HepT-like ribonuclease domain-containing protein [Ciceribacter lividus]RCW28115.1 uncharacterized protein with HEPN domain [Ciceribacter lividus]